MQLCLVARLALDVEHRGKVTLLERNLRDEEVGLMDGVGVRVIEVVCSTDEPYLACPTVVVGIPMVLVVASLGGFHEDEAYGELLLLGSLDGLPINLTLVVRHVDAMHLIVYGKTHAIPLEAIAGFPTIAVGTNEEIIENAKKVLELIEGRSYNSGYVSDLEFINKYLRHGEGCDGCEHIFILDCLENDCMWDIYKEPFIRFVQKLTYDIDREYLSYIKEMEMYGDSEE